MAVPDDLPNITGSIGRLGTAPSMMRSLSGCLATMGSALPDALTAKMAHPGRPVIALVGDGAVQMLGINGLITVAR